MSIELTGLIKPFIDGYKAINEEWNQFFDIALEEYLQSQVEKYYYTNTFLHRHELIRFTDFYYPVEIGYKDFTTTMDDPEQIFKKYRFLMIEGSAGSGKSTLTKYLFLNSIFKNFKIPLLIELRHLNEFDGDLEKLIVDKIVKTHAAPSERIVKRILKKGNFLILLDGYDEIFSTKKQKVNNQIEFFIDAYSRNCFVITTRPGAGIECFNRFYNFNVLSLTPSDITNFVKLMVQNEERKQRLLLTINDVKNQGYIEYLSNPLLLSMFILAFEIHPEIPDKKSAFYKNVFDTLYSKHDGITKNSFPREKRTKLQRDDFENVLSLFSFLSLIDKKITFTEEYLSDKMHSVRKYYALEFTVEDIIYDLVTSISIFIKEGFEFKFPHRSMQEYFAALFISKLPTDKKFKAYENLMDVIQNDSNDNSFNLEEIAMELDYLSFTKSFIIPKLKMLINSLNTKTDIDCILAYAKLANTRVVKFSKDSHYSIVWINGYDNSFLSHFKIEVQHRMILNFAKDHNLSKELKAAIGNYTKSVLVPINVKMAEILLKHGFLDFINNIKSNLFLNLEQFEENTKTQEKNLDAILFN